MDSSSYRHLAFLLSLGGIPLACTSDDTGTSSDTASTDSTSDTSTSGGTSNGTTSNGVTTDETGGSGTMGATTSTSGATSATTAMTSGETTGGTTGEPGSACAAFAEKYAECYPRYSPAEILQYCEEQLGYLGETYGPECVAAFTEYIECQSALTCDEMMADPPPCEATFYAIIAACSPQVSDGCAAFEAKFVECTGEGQGIGQYCQMTINEGTEGYGDACGQAYEELFACLTALECADFQSPDACAKEQANADEACM